MLNQEQLATKGIELISKDVGSGGSAVVHKCRVREQTAPWAPKKGTYLALKDYRPELVASPGQPERIAQEARIGRKVTSEYVVKVFHHEIGDGSPPSHCWLFMEWIDGPTLSSLIPKRLKSYTWDQLRQICSRILQGVHALHEREIFHRDIKPENIMLRGDQPVIMDIGVAEIVNGGEQTMHTKVKDFLGSVRYASPQYLQGNQFAASDDVYSIGCTFLELLSGRQPYYNVERKVLIPSVVLAGPPHVDGLRDGAPSSLKTILRGCLHQDPSRRPTIRELIEFFAHWGDTNYTQHELMRQYDDEASWPVLSIDGYDFYADIGAANVDEGQDFKVVRNGDPLVMPSNGLVQTPQKLIGKARFIHARGTLAHFRFSPQFDPHLNVQVDIQGLPRAEPELVRKGDRVVAGFSAKALY